MKNINSIKTPPSTINSIKIQIFISFLLKDKLCFDLIRKVCDIYLSNPFFFYKKTQVIREIKNLNNELNNKYLDSSNYGDITDDHVRYKYLYRKKQERYRGFHSKVLNNWILFQFYLLTTRVYKKDSPHKYYYGFSSIYDKNNKFKIDHCRYHLSHLLLRNNKTIVIQIYRIWDKINYN